MDQVLYNVSLKLKYRQILNGFNMTDTLEEIVRRLREIYSDTTIRHILTPANNREIPNADGFGECSSGCGETMKIWLRIRDNTISDAGFWTDGCAATIASGSMTTELAMNRSVVQAMKIRAEAIAKALGNLPEGNLHCADLASKALQAALRDSLVMEQHPWKKLYRKYSP